MEEVPQQQQGEGGSDSRRIAKKMIDQDICLSMLGKLSFANEMKSVSSIIVNGGKKVNPVAIPYDALAQLTYDADTNNQSITFEEFRAKYGTETVAMVSAKKLKGNTDEQSIIEAAKEKTEEEPKGAYKGEGSADWS